MHRWVEVTMTEWHRNKGFLLTGPSWPRSTNSRILLAFSHFDLNAIFPSKTLLSKQVFFSWKVIGGDYILAEYSWHLTLLGSEAVSPAT